MQPTTQYVLRLEHPETKFGPYVHYRVENLAEHLGLTYLPNSGGWAIPPMEEDLTTEDWLYLDYSKHVCGVEYMSHFYEWFGINLKPLFDAGFKLYMYLMPVAKLLKGESGLQVAFDKADALEVIEL